MEIGILLLVAVVCSAIGGYYFSSNIADSGSTTGDSALSVCNGLNPENSGTINSFNSLISSEITGGSSKNIQLPYWIENTSKLWVKTDLVAGENIIYLQKDEGYVPNGDDVFIFFDDFSESTIDSTKWQFGTICIDGLAVVKGSQLKTYELDLINTTIKSKYKIDLDTGSTQAYSFGIYDENPTNGFRFINAWFTGYSQYYYQTYYTSTIEKYSTSINYDENNYHNYELTYDGSNMYFTLDGQKYTKSKNAFNLNYIKYTSDSNSYVYVDWVAVTKYIQNKPTIYIELIDENTLKCTINSQSDLENYQLDIDVSSLSISNENESLKIYSN